MSAKLSALNGESGTNASVLADFRKADRLIRLARKLQLGFVFQRAWNAVDRHGPGIDDLRAVSRPCRKLQRVLGRRIDVEVIEVVLAFNACVGVVAVGRWVKSSGGLFQNPAKERDARRTLAVEDRDRGRQSAGQSGD